MRLADPTYVFQRFIFVSLLSMWLIETVYVHTIKREWFAIYTTVEIEKIIFECVYITIQTINYYFSVDILFTAQDKYSVLFGYGNFWFYTVKGLFKAAFDCLGMDIQKSCLEQLTVRFRYLPLLLLY